MRIVASPPSKFSTQETFIYAARARGCASDAEPVTVRGIAAPFRDLDTAPHLRVRAPVITARLARDWRCECTLLFAFYVADSPGVCVSDMPPPWRLFLRGGHRLRCLVSAAPVERSFAKPGAVRVLAELCSLALPPVDTLSAPLCAYLVLCALYFRFAHVNSTLRSRGPGPLGVELCSGPLGDGNGFL